MWLNFWFDLLCDVSGVRTTLLTFSIEWNEGQPQPDSYLWSEENNSSLQTTHVYIPFSFNRTYFPENGLTKIKNI